MIKISAQVIPSDGADIQVLVMNPACGGCRAGCSGPGTLLVLPRSSTQNSPLLGQIAAGQQLLLGLQERDRQSLLWHSLLLPLGGMLTGTVLAAVVNPGDLVVLVGAILGFCLGLVACKPYASNTLHIQEV
ncbi:MAG: positive regulator of sigma E activity [Candidatus Azotimanducaceae bacterium]|jgi:positive regulator of sigma E activity